MTYLRCLTGMVLISLAFIWAEAAAFAVHPDKYTVCTMTINSDNESKLFKKKLDPAQFDFIEIVPEQNTSGKEGQAAGGDDWFGNACKQFKAENRRCDMLVISGHFGGTFFGSSGRRLSLETLEEMGCNNACPGIMNSPKEVFMFGCNTLAGKEKDTRTPEQYRVVLKAEVDDQGNRVFTDAQIEEIVAFRYNDFGQSNKDRMERAFSGVPHLYGFDSVAPLGRNSEESLTRYFKSVPDYAKHLEQIELETSADGMSGALEKVQELNKKTPALNRTIAEAFKVTNFAQCSGDFTEDTSGYCKVFDEAQALSSRIATLRGLLASPGGAKYLALAKQFFEKNPPEKYDPQAKSEFDLIGQNETIRKRFATTLQALSAMPVFALDLVDLGGKLSWLTPDEVASKKGQIAVSLLNQGTIEAKDFICSHPTGWPEIPAASLSASVYQNPNSLEAMTCMEPSPRGSEMIARLRAALNSTNSDVRRYGAWLLGMSGADQPQAREALMGVLRDKNQWVREMAAWALHQSGMADPTTLGALVAELNDPSEDSILRRDVAMAFFQSKLVNGQLPQNVQTTLEKAAKDNDSIVSKIATKTLALNAPPILGNMRDLTATPISKILPGSGSVTTAEGVKFDQVKNPKTGEIGWRDSKTGAVWYLSKNTQRDQYDAEMDCGSSPGERLPSRDDFAVAEQHGIREVIKETKNHWFWSSSAGRDYPYGAYVFYGYYGDVYYGSRGGSNSNAAVLCVGR